MKYQIYKFRTPIDLFDLVPHATAYCRQYKNGKWRIAYYLGIDQKPAWFIRSTWDCPIEAFERHNVMNGVQVSVFENDKEKIIQTL